MLLSNQTLRPLFSFYLPQHRTVIEDVAASSNEITRASQLSTFREKERLSVKHCPMCAKDDVYNLGVAYWHLVHQFPGVEACSKHKIWLVHNSRSGRSHVSYRLLPSIESSTNFCSELAREFSAFVDNRIKTLKVDRFGQHALNSSYFKRLNTLGNLTKNGRVKRKC